MENTTIKVEVISNDKSVSATVDFEAYKSTKEMHDINILDELVNQLLSEIKEN